MLKKHGVYVTGYLSLIALLSLEKLSLVYGSLLKNNLTVCSIWYNYKSVNI